MTCDSVSKLIPLYFYGELTPDEEDRVEQHLDACAACSREMDRQRALAAAFDSRQAAVPPHLLESCRADLMAAIQGGAPRTARPAQKGPGPSSWKPWRDFREFQPRAAAGRRHGPGRARILRRAA